MFVTSISCFAVFVPFFYPVCSLGENVTTAFVQMNESIYEIKWYECPREQQKYLVQMIMFSETPFRVTIFGTMDCSRDTFKKVINSGYSYFMMLRGMDYS